LKGRKTKGLQRESETGLMKVFPAKMKKREENKKVESSGEAQKVEQGGREKSGEGFNK